MLEIFNRKCVICYEIFLLMRFANVGINVLEIIVISKSLTQLKVLALFQTLKR